jgi:hypothetical protein
MVRLVQRTSGQWVLEVSAPVPQPGEALFGKWIPYIARLRGLDVTYGLAREFLGVRNQVGDTQFCVLDTARLRHEILETRSLRGTEYWEFVPDKTEPALWSTTRRQAVSWAEAVQAHRQTQQQEPGSAPKAAPRPQAPAPASPARRRIDLDRIE